MAKPKYLIFSNDVAPERDGVYQREFATYDKHRIMDRWQWARYSDGKWYCAYEDFVAAKYSDQLSAYQKGMASGFSTLRWRGLTARTAEAAQEPK